ncbi:unnamed protein product, partial [Protopolystoma xenopodis]
MILVFAAILELEDEEERRRREEQAALEAEDDDTDCGETIGGDLSYPDADKRSAKKNKAKRRKGNKKGGSGSTASKRKKMDGPMDGVTELSRKVYDTMEKLKEIFFVIRLHRHNSAASLPPIVDPDSLVHSELMESRDAFLQLARERHLEFSSLRRAKFSSMVLLYELHVESRQSFMYTCNGCSVQIETRWHCTECEEYDLCARCYKRENHPHVMVKYGLGIDEEGSANGDGDRFGSSSGGAGSGVSGGGMGTGSGSGLGAGAAGGNGAGPSAADRRNSIERCIKSLVHACQCRDANCRMQTCTQMKRVLCHARSCTKKATGQCVLCKQLLSLCWHHARCCEETKCSVPFCLNIKYRVKQQLLQQRWHNTKLLRRRISTMHRGDGGSSHSGPHHSYSTGSSGSSEPQVVHHYQGPSANATSISASAVTASANTTVPVLSYHSANQTQQLNPLPETASSSSPLVSASATSVIASSIAYSQQQALQPTNPIVSGASMQVRPTASASNTSVLAPNNAGMASMASAAPRVVMQQ